MIKRYKYLFFLVLVAVVFTGCSGGITIFKTGHIVGQVFSSSGAVVEDALVQIDGRPTTTNSNGVFSFNDVVSGQQTITIRHDQFQELKTTVTIPVDNTNFRTGKDGFFLNPKGASTGSVEGEVLFAGSREPVRDARVSIAGRSVLTDAWGEFRIDQLPAGTYTLRVTHSEFQSDVERRVTIQANRPVEFYGSNAILVERWQPPVQTGSVEGYIYVRVGSQMSAMSVEDMGAMFTDQAMAPTGYEPLVDGTVKIGGRTGITNWDGFFRVNGIAQGSYTLTVTSPSLRFPIEKGNVRIYANEVTRFTGSSSLYGGVGYYIVIGIGDYPGEPTIRGSVANAERVYGTLFEDNRLAGLGELLTDRNATKSGIRSAINKAINMADGPDDYLVIYFSGLSGEDYLSPSDDSGGDWSKVITDAELEGWVRDFPGSVTLIIDGAESSTMADGEIFRPYAFRQNEYTVISAAGPGERVFYEPELGSSVFTHFLVKGITGWYPPADLDGNGDITAYELYQYIEIEMDDYLRGDPDRHLPAYYGQNYKNTVIFRY